MITVDKFELAAISTAIPPVNPGAPNEADKPVPGTVTVGVEVLESTATAPVDIVPVAVPPNVTVPAAVTGAVSDVGAVPPVGAHTLILLLTHSQITPPTEACPRFKKKMLDPNRKFAAVTAYPPVEELESSVMVPCQ